METTKTTMESVNAVNNAVNDEINKQELYEALYNLTDGSSDFDDLVGICPGWLSGILL